MLAYRTTEYTRLDWLGVSEQMVDRIGLLFAVLLIFVCHGGPCAAEIETAKDLVIKHVAGDDLVPDCVNLTIAADGRVIASGPGYIRLIQDDDGDGRYDRYETLIEGPSRGAHGMCVERDTLYYVGDGGVWQTEISSGQPSLEPTRVLEIKTGGEHDAHAIRKGPDGYWYLIAGNGVHNARQIQNVKNPQVENPRAGFLLRVSPDWKQREIWAHGFRNAFDFDFSPMQSIVTFDSDGERDVSLPWYRPTRVYRVRQGDDAGWISRSWKRPNHDPEMPVTLAECGRGSPTGVTRVKTSRLGKRYRDGTFVLDWTFGQILFVADQGSAEGVRRVAYPDGNDGFPVTDIAEFPDGRLLVSVGGRGSTGGLYVIDAKEPVDVQSIAMNQWQQEEVNVSDVEQRIKTLRYQVDRTIDRSSLELAIDHLTAGGDRDDIVSAMTLLIEAVGGLGPGDPADARGKQQVAAVFDGYRGVIRPKLVPEMKNRAVDAVLAHLDSQDRVIAGEAIRTLAVLEPDRSDVFSRIVQRMHASTFDHPSDRLHCLIALARLPVDRSDTMTEQVVDAMIQIPVDREAIGAKVDRNWTPRLSELYLALQRRDSLMASRLVSHPDFGHRSHLVWTTSMDPENLERARKIMLRQGRESQFDPAIAQFIADGNDAVPRPVVRQWLSDSLTRRAGWEALMRNPKLDDVDHLQQAFNSGDKVISDKAAKTMRDLDIEPVLHAASTESVASWMKRANNVLTLDGDRKDGKEIFVIRQCGRCHEGGKALGPSLAGTSKRFSATDLFRAIVDPSHSIPDRYRGRIVLTNEGEVFQGMVIYESVDGVTLSSIDGKTLRINADSIERMVPAKRSMMPEGTLFGLTNQQVADLLEYLKQL